MSQTQLQLGIESSMPREWIVQAEERPFSAQTTVMRRQKTMPDRVKPPHVVLDTSREWLALSSAALATKDHGSAIAYAQAGLSELGSHYAPILVRDDTQIKLIVASEQIEKGRLEQGAEIMLRILKSRLLLYTQLHQEALAE